MNENQPQNHEMRLQAVLESGAEEWACPVCGRRFLLQWPNCKKIILEVGDEHAIHVGAKNEAPEPARPITEPEKSLEQIMTEEDEARWQFWQQWMEVVDFERYWTRELK